MTMLRYMSCKNNAYKYRYSGMLFISCIRLLHGNSSLQKSYYDMLGVTPKATQSDIKAAYYKLSLKFHPDRNDGSELATTKFREITEAYEILSNPLKKLDYDRKSANDKFEESYERYMRAQRYKYSAFERRRTPPTWKTEHYNFEEYYKMHYGQNFENRKQSAREKVYEKEAYRRDIKLQKRARIFVITVPLIYLCLFIMIDLMDADNKYSSRKTDSSNR